METVQNEKYVPGRMLQIDHPPLHMSLQENCQELLTPLDILPADPPDSSLNTGQYSHSPLVSNLLLLHELYSQKQMANSYLVFNENLFISPCLTSEQIT